MVYNGETNGQDIVTLAYDQVKANSTTYPINQVTRNANLALRAIWGWIFEAYGGWIYDDRNNTDLPEAVADLVSGQSVYILPLDSAEILGVEIKTQGNVWQKLWPITLEKIQQDYNFAESQFLSTPSAPIYYRPIANGFKLYPACNYSQAGSIKVYFSRDVSAFVPTDTTKSPGFDVEFHEAVSTFVALQYAKINLMGVAGAVTRSGSKTGLLADWSDWEQRIKNHYVMRFQQMFPARLNVQDYQRQMI